MATLGHNELHDLGTMSIYNSQIFPIKDVVNQTNGIKQTDAIWLIIIHTMDNSFVVEDESKRSI